MYSIESLQQKNLKELKEIGSQLNVLPKGDRRLRQNWIDAIAGKNPPLLELLEVSPAAEVEPTVNSSPNINETAIEIQRQEAPIESKFGRIVYPKPAAKPIAPTENLTPGGVNGTDETRAEADRLTDLRVDEHHSSRAATELYGGSKGLGGSTVQHQESGRVLAATRDSERDKGRALLDRPDELETSPGVENFTEGDRPPGRGDGKRKSSTAHQLLELFKSSAHIIPDSPGDETEPELSQSAIVPAAENLLDVEPDPNPILPGIKLSDRFLARYSPPQPKIIHFQADTDGQLSLLDFEVEKVNEPPDPEDYHSMFAFWAAYDAWVEQSDEDEDKPVEISLDSMCEWAPCPAAWYEPAAVESSSTCKFSIPTFGAWCDRAARQTDSDEPPDTGIFARLPGPKPPKFPPRAIGYTAKHSPNTEPQRYCVTYYTAAADSSQPARSPPGGDAL